MQSAHEQTMERELVHLLTMLTLSTGEHRAAACQAIERLAPPGCEALLTIAAQHHVLLRAFSAPPPPGPEALAAAIAHERNRAHHALRTLSEVCRVLEEHGCPVVVIKSLDHWPDMGADLDLLTLAPEEQVTRVLAEAFGASVEMPTWSDRVARKVNFRLPGLPELVEMHFNRIGQAGEHRSLVKRILRERVQKVIAGHSVCVPTPEAQVLLTTLQRLYRHFYMRICDIVDIAALVDANTIDFDTMRRLAKRSGVWPGCATLLRIVAEYVTHYRGAPLLLPRRIWLASAFGMDRVHPNAGFLRLPVFPQGAKLYLRQWLRAARRRDAAGTLRLSLVPPLAVAANLRYKITGDQHGIW